VNPTSLSSQPYLVHAQPPPSPTQGPTLTYEHTGWLYYLLGEFNLVCVGRTFWSAMREALGDTGQ
jgi:hypothetical protein